MFSSVSRSSRGIFERFRSFMCFLLARVDYSSCSAQAYPNAKPTQTTTRAHSTYAGCIYWHTYCRYIYTYLIWLSYVYICIHSIHQFLYIHVYIYIYRYVCIALSWLPNKSSHSERPSFASPKSTFQSLLMCGPCFIFCDDLFSCNKHHSCNCILFIQLTYPTFSKRNINFHKCVEKTDMLVLWRVVV